MYFSRVGFSVFFYYFIQRFFIILFTLDVSSSVTYIIMYSLARDSIPFFIFYNYAIVIVIVACQQMTLSFAFINRTSFAEKHKKSSN